MKPKEKAEGLIDKYLSLNDNFNKPIITDEQDAVKCAIVAVDEIINANPYSHVGNSTIKFWQSVKTELEKQKK